MTFTPEQARHVLSLAAVVGVLMLILGWMLGYHKHNGCFRCICGDLEYLLNSLGADCGMNFPSNLRVINEMRVWE